MDTSSVLFAMFTATAATPSDAAATTSEAEVVQRLESRIVEVLKQRGSTRVVVEVGQTPTTKTTSVEKKLRALLVSHLVDVVESDHHRETIWCRLSCRPYRSPQGAQCRMYVGTADAPTELLDIEVYSTAPKLESVASSIPRQEDLNQARAIVKDLDTLIAIKKSIGRSR